MEFLLVLVLIAVLGAIIGPSLANSLPSARVSRTANAWLATARKAHNDAALTSKRHRLVLRKTADELGGPRFWITVEARPLEEPGVFHPVPGLFGQGTELPELVNILSHEGAVEEGEFGDFHVEFNPDGTATEATVVFGNDQGDSVKVQIKGTTGVAVIPVEESP
jgi:type II secretory pathway pseudopilin PulG